MSIRRAPVGMLDPEGHPDGQVPVISGGKFVIGDVAGGGGSGLFTPYRSLVLADAPAMLLGLGDASGSTATDVSGNGRHGAYVGGVTLGKPGLIPFSTDACVELSTSATDYVTADAAAALLNGATWTVEFVMLKSTAIDSTGNQVIFSAGNSGNTTNFLMIRPGRNATDTATGTGTLARITDGVANNIAFTSFQGFTALRTHFAVTKASGVMRLYIDGIERASVAVTATPVFDRLSLGVLRRSDLVLPNDGQYDEFAVHTTPLTATKIRDRAAAVRLGGALS